MIVICEECGKKYRVDPSKIKGKAASFKCHVCRHVIIVLKAWEIQPRSDSKMSLGSTTASEDRMAVDGDDPKDITPTAETAKTGTRHRRKTGGLSLRTKMLLLFLFIPLLLTTGLNLFLLWHFETTSDLLVRESSEIVTQLAKEEIANLSTAQTMMQSRAKALTDKAQKIALMMLGATLLLTVIIVYVYTHRLTAKIKSLTEVAERISLGELDKEIKATSNDDIGELAEAIARMQENTRLSIERLQRRR